MDIPKIDEYDKKILKIIQEDASISNKDLAKMINLAPSSCLLRVKGLEKSGLIKRRVTVLNERLLGYNITAFLRVELKLINQDSINEFLTYTLNYPQILECYMITGGGLFLMKIIAKDLDDYRDFVVNKLTAINNVGNVETSIVVCIEKDTGFIPVQETF